VWQGAVIAEPPRGDATVEGEVILVDDVDNSSSEDEAVDETAV
jgi:hypothetical protein